MSRAGGSRWRVDDRQQRRSHRIGARFVGTFAPDHVAPPLQANFARQRRVRRLADARYLGIEGIERVQRVTFLGGREQRGNEAVPVRLPNQLRAIGEIIHDAAKLNIQSVAIRPAPTLRPSKNMTL